MSTCELFLWIGHTTLALLCNWEIISTTTGRSCKRSVLNLGGIEVYAIASKREGQMQANPESQCLFIVQIQEMLLNQLLIYKRKIH